MFGWVFTIVIAIVLYLIVLGLTGSGLFALVVGLLTVLAGGFSAGSIR